MKASKPEKSRNSEFSEINEHNKIIYFLDQDTGKYKYMNSGFRNLSGYSIEELNKIGFRSIVKEVINSKRNSFVLENGDNKESFEEFSAVYLIETKEKEKKWIEDNAYTKFDIDGKKIYSIGVIQDVTKKKSEVNIQKVISQVLQAANTVRNLDELFNFIHHEVSELMLVENFYIAFYDKEKDMLSFPYFIDKYDDESEPVKFGKGLTEYVIRNGESALVDKATDSELVAKGEIELVGTQSEIWLGVPLKIKNKTIGALVVQDYEDKFTYTESHKEILETISHPISMAIERKRVEQERENLISKLSELNQSKDRLFSTISHDLRSPFNSLLGFSEILTTEYDQLTDDEIKEYLNVIYESSKNLFGMTNNLLQYSRFQTGRNEFKPENLDFMKLINNSVKILKGNIVKKEIDFKIISDTDVSIFADENMMNSAIQNLVSNAVKFTSKGGKVTVTAKKIDDKGIEKVELIIEDTGIGINETDMKKILGGEMFSTSGTEREYGTGLGLVLIREFVEKNNGELRIESEKNRGSKFTCSFPAV